MTLAQFVEVVRRRCRAESDTNWSDSEIYQLITNRCNEILGIIGLLESLSTELTAVGTQAYDWPDDAARIVRVEYNGESLQEITHREWDLTKSSGTNNQGTPEKWFNWARKIYLVPIPDTVAQTIKFYYEKEHPYIDNSTQTTIDIPSVLHGYLAMGVIADMFAKDLQEPMVRLYEEKWNQIALPAFRAYSQRMKRGGRLRVIGDPDSLLGTDHGVV